MMSYIARTLHCAGEIVRDEDVVSKCGVHVVLAEPGAGKTAFLDYLARHLGVGRIPAPTLVGRKIPACSALIIDSLDEVARLDALQTNSILLEAAAAGASTIVVACRSYVWSEARTQFARDCFRCEPTVMRLEPFTVAEQTRLFQQEFPEEGYEAFRKEVERFDLAPLLGNPEFLKLFARAYRQSGRKFSTKRDIYVDAIRYLASENRTRSDAKRPSIDAIVGAGCAMFAKLLLSGAAGVGVHEEVCETAYPYYRRTDVDLELANYVLDTQLFRPGPFVGSHDPVHRIVAEYAAASHLIRRIEDPTNTLSLRRCLAVIAPNAVVRDELRGMLGWMAALGGHEIQEGVIDVDPYAVIAGGDPSALSASSKRRLLLGLEKLATVDPYFRRAETSKRFSIGALFDHALKDEFERLLENPKVAGNLKELLLELAASSPNPHLIADQARALLIDARTPESVRLAAQRTLFCARGHDHRCDFESLVEEGGKLALSMAATAIAELGVEHFGQARLLSLLVAAAKLYPVDPARPDREIGSRGFLRRLIAHLTPEEAAQCLDALTSNLACSCGYPEPFRCVCRLGPSKIAGLLLDRYFEDGARDHASERIALWIRPLVFKGRVDPKRSPAIRHLAADNDLRRAVQISLFETHKTSDAMASAYGIHMNFAHAGLCFQPGDHRAIVDHAFASGNIALWDTFYAGHPLSASDQGRNELRAQMRRQAYASPDFLRVWTRNNRGNQEALRNTRRHERSLRAWRRRDDRARERRSENFRQYRDQIESGTHWGWLRDFAWPYLYEPDKLDELEVGLDVVEAALANCFAFLAPHVPRLQDVASPGAGNVVTVLQAACLATLRRHGTLEDVDPAILRVIRADGIAGKGYRDDEQSRLAAEVDRLAFPTRADAVAFIQTLVEPQLAQADDFIARTHLIDMIPILSEVRGQLALDWLERFPSMPAITEKDLFATAAQFGNRQAVERLIDARCRLEVGPFAKGDPRRQHWLVRHFFFITPVAEPLWAELSSDADAIFEIEARADSLRFDAPGWPDLNADKLARVLQAFVDKWPKVPLPNSWGSTSPPGETAYRFLRNTIYMIARGDAASALAAFDTLLDDPRLADFDDELKSLRNAALKRVALGTFRPPGIEDIVELIDRSGIATVEDLRALLVEELARLQRDLKGSSTDPIVVFYDKNGKHVDENDARNRVVEKLQERLRALGLRIDIEAHMAQGNRCDSTVSTVLGGVETVLVIEAKGQWNRELYTAASTQLADRYAIHPGAVDQGLYLVFWYGPEEKIVGRSAPSITSAADLRRSIIGRMPSDLLGRIDVVVLDVSIDSPTTRAR